MCASVFPRHGPDCKTIALDGKPFEVIGGVGEKGLRVWPLAGQLRDDPAGYVFKIFGSHPEASFSALAIDHDHLEDAQDE